MMQPKWKVRLKFHHKIIAWMLHRWAAQQRTAAAALSLHLLILLSHPCWLWIRFLYAYTSEDGKLGIPNSWCCGGGPSCVDASHTHMYTQYIAVRWGWMSSYCGLFLSTREGIRWKNVSLLSSVMPLGCFAVLWFLCWSVQPFKGRYGFWRGGSSQSNVFWIYFFFTPLIYSYTE